MSGLARRRAAFAVAAALTLAACSGGNESSPTTTAEVEPATAVASTDSPATTVASETTVAPTTPPTTNPATTAPTTEETLDSLLAWYLAVLNGAELTPDEYEQRFGGDFRSQVPFDDFAALTDQLSVGGDDWSLVETEERDEVSGSFVIAPVAGEPRLRLLIGVDAALGTIETLFLQPVEPPTLDNPPETFDEAASQLEELGRAGVLVADVSAGECAPVDQLEAEALLPIGSVFKLYVLGAVALAIERGELRWEDELVFTPELASLPSGITQNEEPGTALTVLEIAGRMIAISDNTATDMLIDAVGREAVEAIQGAMGHADAEVNRPFVTTRELFIIKLDPDLLARYASTANRAERAAILDDIAGRPLPELTPGDFTGDPVEPDTVEWFATPSDLCRALVYLAGRAEQPGLELVREVMTASPGVPSDEFDEIWFKGGSEPGLIAMAWLVRRGEQTWTITGSVVNPDNAFDETTAALTFAVIRVLL